MSLAYTEMGKKDLKGSLLNRPLVQDNRSLLSNLEFNYTISKTIECPFSPGLE